MLTATATEIFPLIRFTAAGQMFGVNLAHVAGVERIDRLKPILGDFRAHVVGRFARRDGDCTVVGLAEALGQKPTNLKAVSQVLLLNSPAGRYGLRVERVFPVLRVEHDRLQDLPDSIAKRAANRYAGVFLLDGRAVLVINPASFHPNVPADVSAKFDDLPIDAEIPFNANPARSTRLVVFGLPATPRPGRAVGFGLPGNQVIEVTEAPQVTAIPGSPHWAGGLFEWRGHAVPLIDPATWVGLKQSEPVPHRRVVIARTSKPGERLGILAGEAVRVLPLPVPHVPTRREFGLDSSRVKGVIELRGVTLILPRLSGAK